MGGKSSRHNSRNKAATESEETTGEREDESVERLPYFYSELSRSQAEDVMRRYIQYPGSFLVRLSSQHRRYAITVIVEGKIGHVSIYAPAENCFYAEDNLQFAKLSTLINYYRDFNLPNSTNQELEVKLKQPVYRFRRPMPYPYQQNAIIYAVRPPPRDTAYGSVGEHIEAWRRRWNFSLNDSPQRSIFYDEIGRAVSLAIPPPLPRDAAVSSTSTEDVTEPKQLVDAPTVGQPRYLQPLRSSEQRGSELIPLCAFRDNSVRTYYTSMMPQSICQDGSAQPAPFPLDHTSS